MKYLDLDHLNFGEDGRVVLEGSQLQELEASFEVSAGGSGGVTNSDDCAGTTNTNCTKNLRCHNSTNNVSCTNTAFRCRGATNPPQQEL